MGIASEWLNKKAEPYLKTDDSEEIGIGGFTFGARLKETSSFKQKVTENYVEDGSYVNDHIIESPLTLSIDIMIGEIDKRSSLINSELKGLLGNVGVISKYLPSRTQTQLTKINEVILGANDVLNKADDILDDGTQIYNLFNENESTTMQEGFITFIENLYASKIAIAIEMPYRTYNNMVLTSVSIIRDSVTNQAINCTITATQIRYAKVLLVDSKKYFKKPSEGTGGQTESKTNKGVTEPKKKQSGLKKLLG